MNLKSIIIAKRPNNNVNKEVRDTTQPTKTKNVHFSWKSYGLEFLDADEILIVYQQQMKHLTAHAVYHFSETVKKNVLF
jgi:hypothetical protein